MICEALAGEAWAPLRVQGRPAPFQTNIDCTASPAAQSALLLAAEARFDAYPAQFKLLLPITFQVGNNPAVFVAEQLRFDKLRPVSKRLL